MAVRLGDQAPVTLPRLWGHTPNAPTRPPPHTHQLLPRLTTQGRARSFPCSHCGGQGQGGSGEGRLSQGRRQGRAGPTRVSPVWPRLHPFHAASGAIGAPHPAAPPKPPMAWLHPKGHGCTPEPPRHGCTPGAPMPSLHPSLLFFEGEQTPPAQPPHLVRTSSPPVAPRPLHTPLLPTCGHRRPHDATSSQKPSWVLPCRLFCFVLFRSRVCKNRDQFPL